MLSSLSGSGGYSGVNASSTLQKLYSKADANSDSSLTKDELISALSETKTASKVGSSKLSSAVDGLISNLDSDSNGSLSATEFSSFASQFDYGSGSTLLRAQEASGQQSFQANSFFQNGSETDSQGVGSSALQSAGGNRPPPPPGPPPANDQSGTSAANQAKSLYSSLDSDSSGGVSQDELSSALSSALSSKGTSTTDSGSLASNLFSSLDADSDGSVSEDELTSALQSAESNRPPPPPGPPPANDTGSASDPTASDTSSTSSTSGTASGTSSASASSSTSYDPLDTNQDGYVSAEERFAGAMASSTASQQSGVTSSRLSSDTLRFLMSSMNEVAA